MWIRTQERQMGIRNGLLLQLESTQSKTRASVTHQYETSKHLFFLKTQIKTQMEVYMEDTKPGYKTTEFWGKTALQVLTVVSAIKPEANIDPSLALTVIAGLEAIYNLGRAIVKAFTKKKA